MFTWSGETWLKFRFSSFKHTLRERDAAPNHPGMGGDGQTQRRPRVWALNTSGESTTTFPGLGPLLSPRLSGGRHLGSCPSLSVQR